MMRNPADDEPAYWEGFTSQQWWCQNKVVKPLLLVHQTNQTNPLPFWPAGSQNNSNKLRPSSAACELFNLFFEGKPSPRGRPSGSRKNIELQ